MQRYEEVIRQQPFFHGVWRLLWWLFLGLLWYNVTLQSQLSCRSSCSVESVNNILKEGAREMVSRALKCLEKLLEENYETKHTLSHLVGLKLKQKGRLELYASETEVASNNPVANWKVRAQLPEEIGAGSEKTVALYMLTLPKKEILQMSAMGELYEDRMIGLNVRNKTITDLQERVNITMALTVAINENQHLECVFLKSSENNLLDYSNDGCITQWTRGQCQITCSCDHLTFFGVLMVSTTTLSPSDQTALTYITQIGCSLSLFALVITVFLFFTNRILRADVSMRVHISLVFALILLNTHFLPSQAVAALSSNGLCVYIALILHYSLLATFSWMALEGFHIYLLFVRVFNIYVKRYLLKLSVVGWGIPAVIVSLVVIIDRDAYGHVALDTSNPNSTLICYITNGTVKMVTTVGVFGLVFIFNVIMFGVTVKRVVSRQHSKESNFDRAKRDVCTLLGVTTLLGITWGLVFFSFGYLTAPGLYVFCILNSLQGVFIFLWFLMFLRKSRDSAHKTSSETHSTNN